MILRLEGLLESFKLLQTGKERLRDSLRSEEDPLLLTNETVDLCKGELIADHRFTSYRTVCWPDGAMLEADRESFFPGLGSAEVANHRLAQMPEISCIHVYYVSMRTRRESNERLLGKCTVEVNRDSGQCA